jgi:hypothetical protein
MPAVRAPKVLSVFDLDRITSFYVIISIAIAIFEVISYHLINFRATILNLPIELTDSRDCLQGRPFI